MLLHNSSFFRIYFGNAKDQLYPKWYQNLPKDQKILDIQPFNKLKKIMRIDQLMFLNQVHGAKGYVLKKDDFKEIEPFSLDGDYMITRVPNAGIGVMTADCLPIVFYDKLNTVVAIAHAGWRGSVEQIAVKTVRHMQQQFNTDVEYLRVFFGPSIKHCCYRVQKDFIKQLEDFEFAHSVLREKEDYYTFDLPGFNRLQLEDIGIPKEAFRLEYNICTMCDNNFFSYRRDGGQAGRQMTVVSLK